MGDDPVCFFVTYAILNIERSVLREPNSVANI